VQHIVALFFYLCVTFKHKKIVMATKSKMSTSTVRKVTKTTTPPPKPTPTTEAEFRKQRYEKAMADYSASEKENEDYSYNLAKYKKQMDEYKALSPGNSKYVNTSGSRPLTQKELDALNNKQRKTGGLIYKPGSRLEKGVSIDASGEFVGKYGTDEKGKQIPWSKSGSTKSVFEQPYYEQPKAPGKPKPLGSKPIKDFDDSPPIVMKTKPVSLKNDAKLVTQRKLTTDVPVAVEKPTKKKVPKSAKSDFVVVRGAGGFRSLAGQKLTGTKTKKGKIEAMGFVKGDNAARKAVKAENKSTRAARRTFGKEERLATAYIKNQGILQDDNKKSLKAGIKSYAKSNRADKKADKISGEFEKRKADGIYESRKQAVKTAKKAVKYVSRLEKGKIRSFTPEALNKKKTVNAKIEKTTTGKGKSRVTISNIVPTKKSTRTQAGRAVY